MDLAEIDKRLQIAFRMIGTLDKDLFFEAPLERPIVTRLAMYSQTLFSKYNVDCEYGKYAKFSKSVELLELTQTATDSLTAEILTEDFIQWKTKKMNKVDLSSEHKVKLIVPDMVIHRRQRQENNLLFVEAKAKGNAWSTEDSIKLCLVTAGVKIKNKPLKYKYGLQINFKLDSDPITTAEYRFWQEGRASDTLEYAYA